MVVVQDVSDTRRSEGKEIKNQTQLNTKLPLMAASGQTKLAGGKSVGGEGKG